MSRVIEIIHSRNSDHKITVSNSRLTIKFAMNSTPSECTRVQEFFEQVTTSLGDTPLTLRGWMPQGGVEVTLFTDSKKKNIRFSLKDYQITR
jgi:pyridoxine 5'-phosphate synthase PdxJ